MLDKRIVESLDNGVRKKHFVECTIIGGVICPLVRMEKYDVYLYGANKTADNCVLFFYDQGIRVKGIIDQDERKKGTFAYNDVPYIHTSQMQSIENPGNAFVIITTRYFKGMDQVSILQNLIHVGFDKIYAVSDNDLMQMMGNTNPIEYGYRQYIRENIDSLSLVEDFLSDYKSKQVLKEFLLSYIEVRPYSLEQSETQIKYFFGGTREEREGLYSHLDDEVWVNCGANTGDTIFLYFDLGLNAKRVYAFEGDLGSYSSLRAGLEYLPERYREKVSPINEFINDDTNFDKWISERVTLLNADIQGFELPMLKSMETIIKKDRPVLAICVYHKESDLVDIPMYIHSIVDNYKFVLRKYEANIISALRTWELVLYAIPEERYVLDS